MKAYQAVWYSVEPVVRHMREFFEDLWFDRTRRVSTSGNVTLRAAGLLKEHHHDSEFYQPARARHIRQALKALPVADLSDYTFVDLGSGKGRTLFVAAEFPFRQITGVEFSSLLHKSAVRSIQSFRAAKAACKAISTIYGNAKDFVFPEGKLVLYLFNPFGRDTMQVVLDHLGASLQQHPRHVVVVLLWPRCEDMVARVNGMRLVRKVKEYQIFEVNGASDRPPRDA